MTPPISRPRASTRIALWASLVVLAGTGMLSACGAKPSSADDVASLGSTKDSTVTSDSTATSVDPEEAFVDYAKCMRDEGIDMPDPQVVKAGATAGPSSGQVISIDSSGGADGKDPSTHVNLDTDKFKAADKKCKPILDSAIGSVTIDPKVAEEQRQQMLAYAKCMRDNGVDFPDPVFSSDGGGVSVQITGGDMNHDSAKFKAANDACADKLGNPASGTIGASGGPTFSAGAGPEAGS